MSLAVDISQRLGQFELQAQFESPKGLTALFGRSGSGKTSIINAVAGLQKPERGRIEIAGRVVFDTQARISIPAHKRRIGYVFQDARLFPHLSVSQNIDYGLRFNDGSTVNRAKIVEMLGIGALLNRRPNTLSGGEKQRVAIGRALLSNPAALLMDEPLAALDNARKREILPYLQRLRDDTALPILYVSHSVAEVARLANHVVVLDNGKVVGSGPAREMLADPDIAPAFGLEDAGSVVNASVSTHHPDGLTEVQISGGALHLPLIDEPIGSNLRVRIAAKDVIIALSRPANMSALNCLPATIISVRPGRGAGAIVQLKVGSDKVLARITKRSVNTLDLRPGQMCYGIFKSVSVAKLDAG